MWISEEPKRLQARLMIAAHMKELGYQRVEATVARLLRYCW